MRRYLYQILISFGCVSNVHAQSNGIVVNGKWGSQISITDVNGRPFVNKYSDVNGTPYFNAEYKSAKIKLNQGRIFVDVKMRINLATQETSFISANGVEGYMVAGMVKEITYADTAAEGVITYKFQTGFPPIDKQNENNFYQVLSEGRCSFVKSIVKTVIERKNELSGEIAKDFETTENYYLFSGGKMKRIKKSKEFFLSELTDKQAEITLFIQSNQLSFKNTDHLIKLLNYYNSL